MRIDNMFNTPVLQDHQTFSISTNPSSTLNENTTSILQYSSNQTLCLLGANTLPVAPPQKTTPGSSSSKEKSAVITLDLNMNIAFYSFATRKTTFISKL